MENILNFFKGKINSRSEKYNDKKRLIYIKYTVFGWKANFLFRFWGEKENTMK